MANIYTKITASAKTPSSLNYPEFSSYSDSQDIKSLENYFGETVKAENFGCFFVSYSDGDYGEVYGSHAAYPTNFAQLYRIELVHS